MRSSPGTGGHFAAVGNFLHPTTPAQHLDIIKNGLGNNTDSPARMQALTYAREHLPVGPELIDAQLTIAENSMWLVSADPSMKWDRKSRQHDQNTEGVNETLAILTDVVDVGMPLGGETYSRIFSLLKSIRELQPIRQYGVLSGDTEKTVEPFDSNPQRGSSGLASTIRAIDIGRQLPKRKRPGEEQIALLAYKHGIAALSAEFIQRAVDELESPATVVGKPLHHAYLDLAKWVITKGPRGTNERNDAVLSPSQAAADMIVDKALAYIDVDTPDAMEVYLDLHNNSHLNYRSRERMFARAVEATRHSSHESEISRTRFLFGVKREERQESQFERRRSTLIHRVSSNLLSTFKHNPERIGLVLELYDADEAMALWQKFAKRIVGRSFHNGHYSPAGIQSVGEDLASLRGIAPEQAVQEAERYIRDRLATATVAN